jgi:putative solute:sodium symporter small subunit
MSTGIDRVAYWKDVSSFTMVILALWFVFGYVLPIFLVDALNTVHIGGFPLGFWFAQNGSIYAFGLLTLWYAKHMKKLDDKHGVAE